jgi:hypothetical protein
MQYTPKVVVPPSGLYPDTPRPRDENTWRTYKTMITTMTTAQQSSVVSCVPSRP